MSDVDKIKAFVKATGLHAAEGVEFGMSPGEVAKLLIAIGVGLHMDAYGNAATSETLRKQADMLEGGNG